MQAQINFPSIFRGADCRYFTLLSKTILEGLFTVDYDIVGGYLQQLQVKTKDRLLMKSWTEIYFLVGLQYFGFWQRRNRNIVQFYDRLYINDSSGVILKPWIWHFRCSHHFETRLDKQEWALMEKPRTRQANTLWLINYKAALHHSLLYCLFPVTGTETPNWDHKLVREVFTEVINQVRMRCFPFFYKFL